MSPRIASLFSGTGALDIAVQTVFGGEVIWHCQYEPPDKNGKEDKNQYAARILARHWPTVPNLGDVTKVDWPSVIEEHGPINVLTGGFPCQDVSTAGKRAGLTSDSRSGLWSHMARAIHDLNPELVIIENVEGLLSSKASRGMEPGTEALDEDPGAGGILRALGAVLGDLAVLGFHAEWQVVAASAIGAPHRRRRCIIYAWRTDADPANLRHQWSRQARRGGNGPADSRVDAAHASGPRREGASPEWGRPGRCDPAPADAGSVDAERRGVAGVLGGSASAEPGEGDQRQRAGHTARDSREVAADTDGRRRDGDEERDGGQDEPELGASQRLDAVRRGVQRAATPNTQGIGRGEGRPEPARQQRGPDAAERGCATPADASGDPGRLGDQDDVRARGGEDGREPAAGRSAPADTDDLGRRADVLQLRPGQPDLDWGDYEPAIRRWERVLGRPAPWPTDAAGRLSPVFTEWLMGLPDGWVTATPGLTRPAMLKALGNGVVWQQAVAALHALHQRAISDPQDPAETWAA